MTGIIFLSIFFGIILLLIVIAVFGSKKDKRERQVKMIQSREDNESAKSAHESIYILLYETITNLEQELKEFKPSVGTKSMKQINDAASKVVNDISNSEELRNLFLIEERKTEFEPIIKQLKSVTPKKWESDAFFSYNLVKAKGKAILDAAALEAKKAAKRKTAFVMEPISPDTNEEIKEPLNNNSTTESK